MMHPFWTSDAITYEGVLEHLATKDIVALYATCRSLCRHIMSTCQQSTHCRVMDASNLYHSLFRQVQTYEILNVDRCLSVKDLRIISKKNRGEWKTYRFDTKVHTRAALRHALRTLHGVQTLTLHVRSSTNQQYLKHLQWAIQTFSKRNMHSLKHLSINSERLSDYWIPTQFEAPRLMTLRLQMPFANQAILTKLTASFPASLMELCLYNTIEMSDPSPPLFVLVIGRLNRLMSLMLRQCCHPSAIHSSMWYTFAHNTPIRRFISDDVPTSVANILLAKYVECGSLKTG